MTTSAAPLLQYTSVRTREVNGQLLIGLKHTYKDDAGQQFKTEWIEMTPEDAAGLAKTLLGTVGEVGPGEGA